MTDLTVREEQELRELIAAGEQPVMFIRDVWRVQRSPKVQTRRTSLAGRVGALMRSWRGFR